MAAIAAIAAAAATASTSTHLDANAANKSRFKLSSSLTFIDALHKIYCGQFKGKIRLQYHINKIHKYF